MTSLRQDAINLINQLPENKLAYIMQIIKGIDGLMNQDTIPSPKKESNDYSDISREGARQAFYELRNEAKENGLQNMTLEEINAEIASVREERKKYQIWFIM